MKYARRSVQLFSVYFHFSYCGFVFAPGRPLAYVLDAVGVVFIIFIIFARFSFTSCLCVCSTGNSRTRAHLACNIFCFFVFGCPCRRLLVFRYVTFDCGYGIWAYIFACLPGSNRKLFCSLLIVLLLLLLLFLLLCLQQRKL